MSKFNILWIGDPHFQISNVQEVELFITEIETFAKSQNPDLIVIAGDILHNHERLHTIPLNLAYDLVSKLRAVAMTYIIVGNHDYISNSQFLTDQHWMNAMKLWDNVVIVDKVIVITMNSKRFIFVPYVSPGRFFEALNTIDGLVDSFSDTTLTHNTCIFAHQEFYGCKMGAIVSSIGDVWPINYPNVISGHIHSKQTPQVNLYYGGTPMQHSFGETESNSVAILYFSSNSASCYTLEEIVLKLPVKKIVYLDIKDITNYSSEEYGLNKTRLTVSGNYDEFKLLKRTDKFKDLVNKGVKIVFKPTTTSSFDMSHFEDNSAIRFLQDHINFMNINKQSFISILFQMISEQRNPFFVQSYDEIVLDKKSNIDEIAFI